MSAFLNTFIPTLKLEEGMCFTVLKNVHENEVSDLSEKLEFTIWSPECYGSRPIFPSDILAYTAGEMRIYHASEQTQIDKLFAPYNSQDIKICGYRPRSSQPFQLKGMSFTDELPGDMVDVPAGVLELTGYALDDLCQIINDLQQFSALMESTAQYQGPMERSLQVLPRVIKVITDDLDDELIKNFRANLQNQHSHKDKRRFFKLFFDTFLTRKAKAPQELFVELMVQRAKAVSLFNDSQPALSFLKSTKSSLKPLLSSIDIVLYKNFIEVFHEDVV